MPLKQWMRRQTAGLGDARQRPGQPRDGGDTASTDGTENINAGTPPDRPQPLDGPGYVITVNR